MTAPLAIVTGTTRGLGRALVGELLGRGWRVLGLARSAAPAEWAARGYRHLTLDLTDLSGLEQAFCEGLPASVDWSTTTRLGLVNNAALLDVEPTHGLSARSLADSLLAGAAAPSWLMGWALRAAPDLPLRIVNVSSGAAANPYPGWSAYCQSKAALDMAGAVLGAELAETPELVGRDVAVVSYSPGVVDTQMQALLREADPLAFPRRQRFVDLARAGELVPPAAPAREIADLLEADDLAPFSRRRHGS